MDQLRRHLETTSGYLVATLRPSWSYSEYPGILLGFLCIRILFDAMLGPVGPCLDRLGSILGHLAPSTILDVLMCGIIECMSTA